MSRVDRHRPERAASVAWKEDKGNMKGHLETRPQDRRLFPRIEVNFLADTSTAGTQDAQPKGDRVRLLDVSGNGVKFSSRRGDAYRVGQKVLISIYLPATSEVKAFMAGQGTVVRVQRDAGPDAPPRKRKEVAITLDTPLRLVRAD